MVEAGGGVGVGSKSLHSAICPTEFIESSGALSKQGLFLLQGWTGRLFIVRLPSLNSPIYKARWREALQVVSES